MALFVALTGGSAYAAGQITGRQIAKNAITSRHLAPHSVRRSDVARGAIDSKRIRDHSVRPVDMAAAPAGRMSRAGTLYYAPGNDNIVTYDRLDFGSPKNAFQPGRGIFVAPSAGDYVLTGSVDWAPGTGVRTLTLKRGFSQPLAADSDTLPPNGPTYTQQVVGIARLKAGDSVSLWVSGDSQGTGKTSGAALSAALAGG